MKMNPFDVESLDASVLTPIIRKSMHSDTFSIQDWHVSRPGTGVGNPVSLGLYRFAGTGQDQGKYAPWSVILKVIQSPANAGQEDLGEGDDPTHWNYWKREPLIYQSGLLETLPGGLTAPRCFGIVEMPGNIVCLWLEDIIGSDVGAWSFDQYALAARHLGQLNGIYLSDRSLPSYPWFSRHPIQQRIEGIPWQKFPWEHPKVLAHYPRLETNPFQHMLADHERFLEMLERLPQTFCHNDTYPTNFISRELPNGQQQTVALDWALAGIAPVGADLGQLVFGAQDNLKDVNQGDIDTALFESYIAGLKDSGSKVEPQLVRFGYSAYAALQVGLFMVFLLNRALEQNGTTLDQDVEQPAGAECFEVVMAYEAYRLIEVMG